LKITAVKTAATSGHCMHLWVRIETDAGITGLGECVHGGHQAIAIIQHELADMLIGRDPFAIDALFEEMRRRRVFEGGFAGALITALTGIEIALWDLKGKALKVPVYELMGGKFRDDIRLYADCEVSPGMNMAEVQAVVDEVVEAGFTALKVDLDIRAYGHTGSETGWYEKDRFNMTPNRWEHDRMVELVGMVVKAAGTSVEVACDLHTMLDKHSAIRLARDLEPLGLMWLEEPVPPENIDVMAEITRSTSTPICAGENLYLRHGFRKLLEQQAVDIIMPDIPKCGGLSECRKIAEMADLYSMCPPPSAPWPRPMSAPPFPISWCSSSTGSTATTGQRSPTAARSSRTAKSNYPTAPASAWSSMKRWRKRISIPARRGSRDRARGRVGAADELSAIMAKMTFGTKPGCGTPESGSKSRPAEQNHHPGSFSASHGGVGRSPGMWCWLARS
jgi:L-alanine-DL-glutamate epimerase-like enolase superfamily enzyme